MQDLAKTHEMPLLLDFLFEATVERATFDGLPGSAGAIRGPAHTDSAPVLETPYVLPMRAGELGEPVIFVGRVVDLDGVPIGGATVDVWQSAADGTYSGINAPSEVPPENLRGVMRTSDDGRVVFRSIRPSPYQAPETGPAGRFLRAIGWRNSASWPNERAY